MPKNLYFFALITVFVWFTTLRVQTALAADLIPPVTTHTINPSSPDGEHGWYVTPVNVTLTATDLDTGISDIYYRIDGGTWVQNQYSGTLNLAPNPSFEDYSGVSSIATANWESTTSDPNTSYVRDTANYPTGFATTSIKVSSTAPGWHGINNAAAYSTASPLVNMSASVWVKTESILSLAYFKVYSVALDGFGQPVYTYIGQSSGLAGTNNWTRLNLNFVVVDPNSVGVYLDIGMDGVGTVWLDAVSINTSTQMEVLTFPVATDGNHTVEYYSVDRAGNTETYNCGINDNCITFKVDMTPPGNWHDSGAFRGLFGNDHQLYVYTTVEDPTSGLSVFTDHYQYHTDRNPGFGRFSNLLSCNSTWQPNTNVILISPPFIPGVHSAYLLTPKTEFCNNDWKTCKTVRFFSEDMAGNIASKDYCINGPWVKFRGKGTIRSNNDINMIAEPNEDNTDGLIEASGDTISYFNSSTNWQVKNSVRPYDYDYAGFKTIARSDPTTRTSLTTSSGIYEIEGNFEIKNLTIPSGYGTSTFNQVVFIDGNLRITNNVSVATNSTALFIVHGNVEIAKAVTTIGIGIYADGEFFTAYDIAEGEGASTLNLNGVYSANKFTFQRTLQGTNNNNYPSESFVYEPKYITSLRDYFGTNSILWRSSD